LIKKYLSSLEINTKLFKFMNAFLNHTLTENLNSLISRNKISMTSIMK
jgi:hypothetical protein